MTRFLLILFAFTIHASAANWYVATNGTAGAAGTIGAPINLTRAISDGGLTSPAQPGDTIYLRGGTYLDTAADNGQYYWSRLAPVGSHITVKSYAAERPIIQATSPSHQCLLMDGSNVWWQGIEFWNSGTPRANRAAGVFLRAPGAKLINCIIHDTGVVYAETNTVGGEISGCLIYNYGDQNLPQKHALYIHSTGGAANPFVILDNITYNGFYLGLQCYSEDPNQMDGYVISGNTIVNPGSLFNDGSSQAGILVGGQTWPADHVTVTNNYCWISSGFGDGLYIGYQGYENGTMLVRSNYCANGRFTIGKWANLTYTGNTFLNSSTYCYFNRSSSVVAETWDNNVFYLPFAEPMQLNGTPLSWADWKLNTGFDAHSSFLGSLPAQPQVFVRTNAYEAGRANITIFGWSGTSSVSVDVSSVMSPGANYSIHNAANFFGPAVLSGTYLGGNLSIPMSGLSVATPVGTSAAPATGTSFNAFILQSNSSGAPPSPGTATLTAAKVKLGRVTINTP